MLITTQLMVALRQEKIKKKNTSEEEGENKKRGKKAKRQKLKNYQELSRPILSQLFNSVVEFTFLLANILPIEQY